LKVTKKILHQPPLFFKRFHLITFLREFEILEVKEEEELVISVIIIQVEEEELLLLD
jgi:hypothetical protein